METVRVLSHERVGTYDLLNCRSDCASLKQLCNCTVNVCGDLVNDYSHLSGSLTLHTMLGQLSSL